MNRKSIIGLALAGALATAVVSAAVIFDPASGMGFVGKGDVQLKFGWNNKQLQDNAASVDFRALSEVVTQVSWECTNTKNEKVQERSRTTTTSTQGVVSSILRERNQITGFILNGYKPDETTSSEETDGPPVNSCPNENGNWSLTTPAGEPEVVSSTSTLQVGDGGTWYDLP